MKVGQVVDATRRSARNIVRVTIILRVTMTTVRVTYNDNIVRVRYDEPLCTRNIVLVRMITCVLVSGENVRVVVKTCISKLRAADPGEITY